MEDDLLSEYMGDRLPNGTCRIAVVKYSGGKASETYPLDPRLDLRNHSPTGFEWGYGGSGPAQAALALLADALEDDSRALQFYQEFKSQVLAKLSGNWKLTLREVRDTVERIEGIRRISPAEMEALDKEMHNG